MNILNKTLMIAVGILFTLLLFTVACGGDPTPAPTAMPTSAPTVAPTPAPTTMRRHLRRRHGDACSHCHIDTDIGTKSHSDAITHCNTNPGYYGAI